MPEHDISRCIWSSCRNRCCLHVEPMRSTDTHSLGVLLYPVSRGADCGYGFRWRYAETSSPDTLALEAADFVDRFNDARRSVIRFEHRASIAHVQEKLSALQRFSAFLHSCVRRPFLLIRGMY